MLAERFRTGLAETSHEGAVAVCAPDGSVVARFGDIDRPFFLRSAAKPFQAFVSQRSGAGLGRVEFPLACASHRGQPVHVAIVSAMLAAVGLDEDDLGCPADWPLSSTATRSLIMGGHRQGRRVFHNCSGKHTGFLRACVSSGWPTDSYLEPDHPLQREILDFVSDVGDFDVRPVGVDGCGAPVMRATVRSLATMFARLAGDTELIPVFEAMHRYPALVSGNGEGDADIATAIDAVAKGGAAGCIGVGVRGKYGVGAKCWDGSHDVAVQAAVATLEQLGSLSPTALHALDAHLNPVTLGGGRPVGNLVSRLILQ